MNPAPDHHAAVWRPAGLATGLVLSAMLFVSWRAGWWMAADEAVFRYFNAQLATPGLLQTLWAITNWRPFDITAALMVALLTLAWMRESEPRPRLAQFFAFCLLLLAAKACEHVISDLLHVRRLSPTLTFDDAVRLSELVSWVTVKDRGSTVFPGDHAFVIFATMGFFWLHAGRARAAVTSVLLAPFVLPRIAVGAHWLTDVAVGGLAMALLMLCAAYATPLGARLAAVIERRGDRALDGLIALARWCRLLPR